jgi:hypothetical protein
MLRSISPRRLTMLTAASVMTIGLVATQAGAALPSKTVPPKQWAKKVCPPLRDFNDDLQSIDTELADATTAAEAQSIIITGLDETMATVEDAAASIKAAGTPDSKRGKKAARTLNTAMADADDILLGAQALVADLAVGDPTQFADEAQAIQDQVFDELGTEFAKFAEVDPKLFDTIGKHPDCATL